MKMVMAMVCSLLLVGTSWFPAQAVSTCAKQPVRACCRPGGQMACCTAPPVSNSRPAPANPVRTNVQNDVSLLPPTVLAVTLSGAGASTLGPLTSLSLSASGAPLYARHCARLI